MSKVVTIHQPQYLPWIPYFAKILAADEFILLDNVQFQKNGVQNRNQIKTPNGKMWLTVPVKHEFGQKIKDTMIANQQQICKHLKSIRINYQKSPYFDEVFFLLSEHLSEPVSNLSELNSKLIIAILNYLGYKGKIVYASALYDGDAKGSQLILELCKAAKAEFYFSGHGGKNYMDIDKFKNNSINVLFHNYKVPMYHQLYPKLDFMGDLSIIDLMFNVGEESMNIIQQGQLLCEKS